MVGISNQWPPDYVFENNYELLTLKEVETYINENKHLPGVKSAKEIQKGGVGMGEMSTVLLKKTEELTLYSIDHDKKIIGLENEVLELKKLIEKQQMIIDNILHK